MVLSFAGAVLAASESGPNTLELVLYAIPRQPDDDHPAARLISLTERLAQRSQIEHLVLCGPSRTRGQLVRHDVQTRLNGVALGERAVEAQLEGGLCVGASTHADLEGERVAIQVEHARLLSDALDPGAAAFDLRQRAAGA